MVMLSVYVAVLWRWCGQRDFILPFNIAGRQSDHKSVVGYFSHIVYLRIELTGQETFSQVLSLVSNEFFRALAHQDFGRRAAEQPDLLSGVFCQWVTWHAGEAPNGPAVPLELEVERLPLNEFGQGLSILPPGVVDVDLTFFDTAQGIYAQGVYRADRFTPGTMDRLMSDLRSATEYFVANPGGTHPELISAGSSGF
jgi:non-ribosomal peptide synthetase component F